MTVEQPLEELARHSQSVVRSALSIATPSLLPAYCGLTPFRNKAKVSEADVDERLANALEIARVAEAAAPRLFFSLRH